MYQGHSDLVYSLCFDSSNNLFSTGFDGSIKKWNMATGKVAYSFENRDGSGTSLSADGRLLLVGLRCGSINAYNIDDASALYTISINKQAISSLLALNGLVYGSGLDGLLVKFPASLLWNISTVYNSKDEQFRSLSLNSRYLILLSGETKALFFSDDKVVKTVDLQTALICMTSTENFLLGDLDQEQFFIGILKL
jgi:WD40 repeat protein